MGRTLIVGASGQVGGALVERLGAAGTTGTYHERSFPGGHRLDLAEVAAEPSLIERLVTAVGPEVVVLASAMTHVDGCEENERQALLINRDAAGVVARTTHRTGARTVFFSTEYVFDGSSGPYSETDEPNPVSVYGRSKLEGESAVLEADPQALVLRTTVVFGPEERGLNFAYRLAGALSAGETLRAPHDQLSNPTYNRDLAETVVRLLDAGAKGIFNVVGPETVDRATFARRLARAAGLDDALVEGVETSSLAQKAERPLLAGLLPERLLATLPGLRLRNVEQAAAHWISNPRGKPWPGP
jgi:dTDP-4-dehydrorhamnose reductase